MSQWRRSAREATLRGLGCPAWQRTGCRDVGVQELTLLTGHVVPDHHVRSLSLSLPPPSLPHRLKELGWGGTGRQLECCMLGAVPGICLGECAAWTITTTDRRAVLHTSRPGSASITETQKGSGG